MGANLFSVSQITRFVVIFALTCAFTYIIWPFLIPLILAGVFALGLADMIHYLNERIRFRRIYLVAFSLFFGIALFWIPMTLAIYRIILYFSQPNAIDTKLMAISNISKLNSVL